MIGENTDENENVEAFDFSDQTGEEREQLVEELLNVDPDEITSLKDIVLESQPERPTHGARIQSVSHIARVTPPEQIAGMVFLLAEDEGIHMRATYRDESTRNFHEDNLIATMIRSAAERRGISPQQYIDMFRQNFE